MRAVNTEFVPAFLGLHITRLDDFPQIQGGPQIGFKTKTLKKKSAGLPESVGEKPNPPT
jgi:hypothetical protein